MGAESTYCVRIVAVRLFLPELMILMIMGQDFNLQGSAGSRAHEDAFSRMFASPSILWKNADPYRSKDHSTPES